MNELKELLERLQAFNKLTVLGRDIDAVTPDMGKRYLVDEKEQAAIDTTINSLTEIIDNSNRKLNVETA